MLLQIDEVIGRRRERISLSQYILFPFLLISELNGNARYGNARVM